MRLRAEGRKVVIADDAQEILDLLCLVLEQRGYQVFPFTDGGVALAHIPEIHPDLVILDILMPGADGLEVCDAVKANPTLNHIPVFLMTSATTGSEVADGFWKIGTRADAFFSKPFNPLEVAAYADKFVMGVDLPAGITLRSTGGGAARIRH
jgi:CheY-like chemotaxis protein